MNINMDIIVVYAYFGMLNTVAGYLAIKLCEDSDLSSTVTGIAFIGLVFGNFILYLDSNTTCASTMAKVIIITSSCTLVFITLMSLTSHSSYNHREY